MSKLKKISWIRFTFITLGLIGAGLNITLSHAQADYPSKPINFIVPYGAGGGADSRSRQIAQRMSAILKQSIIVENKAGATGNIAMDYVAQAKPDGYTVILTSTSTDKIVIYSSCVCKSCS